MPSTLVLACRGKVEETDVEWEPFVLVAPEFPSVPEQAVSFVAYSANLREAVSLTTSVNFTTIHHRLNSLLPETTILMYADVHEPLPEWERGDVIKAFLDIGWKALTVTEATEKYPFFNFS